MSTKIQINNLEALERLLGGDTEFEIEVRQSTAAAFAKKALKPLLNSIDLETMVKDELFGKEVINQYGLPTERYTSKLAPKYQEALGEIINRKVVEAVQSIVTTHLDALVANEVRKRMGI